jgi:hypothetical protein
MVLDLSILGITLREVRKDMLLPPHLRRLLRELKRRETKQPLLIRRLARAASRGKKTEGSASTK